MLIFGSKPFNSLPMTFRICMAGRTCGNNATVIKSGHPALAGFPHEGFCGWQFRRLMEGGEAVQLEGNIAFDPIIDVASAVKFPIRQSALFEYRVGKGRLLVCSFKFAPDDPAALWLKNRLREYFHSTAFAPKQSITLDELRTCLEAPALTGANDLNRAMNCNDPSNQVRAYELAQP